MVPLPRTVLIALLLGLGAPPIAAAQPARVEVGAYVADVMDIDLERQTYAIDFYLWFRWRDPSIDPSRGFEFINASDQASHQLRYTYEEPEVMANGERYQVLHVQGRFHRPFALSSYPFDRQILTVVIEDRELEIGALEYIADEASLDASVVLPGFAVEPPRIRLDRHEYPTNFGDRRITGRSAYSRATLEIPVRRPMVAHLVKVVAPILCAMLCSFLMFLLPAPESRVTVGITSLLTVVALALRQGLPAVAYLILLDRIYIASYAFIVAGLAVNVWTIRRDKSKMVDRRVAAGMTATYLVTVLAMIVHAVLTG